MKKSLIAMACSILFVFCGLSSAVAAEAPSKETSLNAAVAVPARGSVTYTRYDTIDLKKTPNWTNKAEQIGICKIRKGAGGTCQISNSYSVSTSISTSFGLTAGHVASTIGFNKDHSVSSSVTWTSPSHKKGSAAVSYKAWAVGTKATYKIQKWKGYKALGQKNTRWVLESTSPTLTAFSPVKGFEAGK